MLSVYFSHPLVLALLLLLPPLIWWHVRRRRPAIGFPALGVVAKLPRGRSQLVRVAGAAGRALALALLIFALAGPRWPDEGSRIPTEGISIAIVLDVSYSMTDEDFVWDGKPISRLEAVKKVFNLFVNGGRSPDGLGFDGRANDLVALVVFAEYPETVCPLTLDHKALTAILERQNVRKQEWTNIGDSIAWALRGLIKSGEGKKVVILLTDGEQTKTGAALKPRQAAQLAGNMEIPIYAITAGKEPAELTGAKPEDVENRKRALEAMADVAKLSKGRAFQAGDTRTLLEICQQIDELESAPIQSFQYRRYYQGFAWFALSSFALLFGLTVLELTFWRRVP